MHDTAYQIGTLALRTYGNGRRPKVLEIGSKAVNGSLRDGALPGTDYTGVDIEAGDGVDIVVVPGKPLPLESDKFDLVLASSVFEHDPAFWITFLEMCRVTKPRGYIYINAPSNGIVHRYPMDNWRFYPDAGKALVEWALSQNVPALLVESFIANRESDIWNDFVAVFRKGAATSGLPKTLMFTQVACTNVLTWNSADIAFECDAPEDLILLERAKERAGEAENSLNQISAQRDEILGQRDEILVQRDEILGQRDEILGQRDKILGQHDILATQVDSLESRIAEHKRIDDERESARLALEQRIEHLAKEVARLTDKNEEARIALVQFQAELSVARTEAEQRSSDLRKSETELGLQRGRSEELQRELENLSAANVQMTRRMELQELQSAARLNEAIEERDRLKGSLSERERELSQRSGELFETKAELASERELGGLEREKSEWLRRVSELLLSKQGRWRLFGSPARPRGLHELLRRDGLFDAEAYITQNPDVALERFEPLRHYLVHGVKEGRARPIPA